MAMFVQHNMAAMNANRMLGAITNASGKATEKLASGYRINRAADDAAGLAISEKMRGQIRGLNQASTNAQDGISLIQTAEGALAESHSILQRMRELAVQAANGTETDEDRSNIQDEIAQLQDELDRIAETTEFNTMKLLDGTYSASGATSSSAGPKYGQFDGDLQAFITSNIEGVTVITNTTATAGGESAQWDEEGKTLKINLAHQVTYSQGEIDALIANAFQEDSNATNAPASVTVKFSNGVYTAAKDTESEKTVAGTKATTQSSPTEYMVATSASIAYTSEKITITSDKKDFVVKLATAASEGVATAANELTLTLKAGTTYTQKDIDELLKKAVGADANVKIVTDGEIMTSTSNVTAAAVTTVNPVADSYTEYVAGTDMPNYTVESDTYGVKVNFANAAAAATSAWAAGTNTLTITLEQGQKYTQAQIDELVAGALANTANAPEVKVTLDQDITTAVAATTASTSTGANTPLNNSGVTITNTDYVGANKINITSNKYGADYNITIDLDFTAEEGKEGVTVDSQPTYAMSGADLDAAIQSPGKYTLSLQAGKEYTEEDIQAILAEAGLDVTVKLSGNQNNGGTDTPNTLRVLSNTVQTTIKLTGGTGIGDEDAFLGQAKYNSSGASVDGLSLQVGANKGQTISFNIEDMSAAALGVSGSSVRVDEQKKAQESITVIDAAIQKVSKQRSQMGAIQNRLEHTIANLDTSAENLQTAESRIRDTDMAETMVEFSKNNILQQAAQSMLAQANQSAQGVLSLLG